MTWIKKQYNNYRNGIIFTLIFHILLFIVLNISQFNIRQEYKEDEIIIDFPPEMLQEESPKPELKREIFQTNTTRTNRASNQSIKKTKEPIDQNLQQEITKAQKLVKDVSKQLAKEIPTIDNLKMPEETTENKQVDSLLNKLYSGDSNVEYFLEKRYHVRLPIPVYLAQYGGQITVNITVDKDGNVIKADPVVTENANEQLLSYAKTAALRTKFNADPLQKPKQNGYIKYTFIAQ